MNPTFDIRNEENRFYFKIYKLIETISQYYFHYYMSFEIMKKKDKMCKKSFATHQCPFNCAALIS